MCCCLIVLVFCLSQPLFAQEPTERTILVAGQDGKVLTQLQFGDETPIRLTDQLGQSFALRAAGPAEGFIELVDDKGKSVVLGRDAGE
jgi:hypothetical protein